MLTRITICSHKRVGATKREKQPEEKICNLRSVVLLVFIPVAFAFFVSCGNGAYARHRGFQVEIDISITGESDLNRVTRLDFRRDERKIQMIVN